jgi:competence protein ComGF
MRENKRIKYVYTVFLNNERGFTLISMLLTAAILFITIPLLTYLIKSSAYSSHYDELNVQQFFHLLQNEVDNAAGYTINSNIIKLVLPEESGDGKLVTATFEQYDNLIRRRVDNQGHEVYLRDVETFKVSSLPYGFRVNVLTLQGVHYEKTIVFYNW